MSVAELMALLKEQDQSAHVLVYSNEDFSTLRSVHTREEMSNPGTKLYCKGYSFDEYNQDTDRNYIILGDTR